MCELWNRNNVTKAHATHDQDKYEYYEMKMNAILLLSRCAATMQLNPQHLIIQFLWPHFPFDVISIAAAYNQNVFYMWHVSVWECVHGVERGLGRTWDTAKVIIILVKCRQIRMSSTVKTEEAFGKQQPIPSFYEIKLLHRYHQSLVK